MVFFLAGLCLLLLSDARGVGFLRGELYLANGFSSARDFLHRDSVGVEGYGKLTGERGDWATVALQLRLVRYLDLDMDNRVILRDEEWEPEFHTTYINLKGFFGRLNLKIGHLEIPFGLEPTIDTHSVLVPSTAMVNLGAMQDWGASLNGQLRWFDYEVALTSGAAMLANFNPFRHEKGMYLASMRIQPVLSGNTQVGISALIGEMNPMEHGELDGAAHDEGASAERLRSERRVGIDLRTSLLVLNTVFDARWEAGVGTRDGQTAVSLDGAVSREFGDSWRGLVGARFWRHGDNDPDVWGILSVRHQVISSLAWEVMLSQDFSRESGDRDTSFLTLIYFTR
jgi:hypothetical protein